LRAVLTSIGTTGDIYPFLALAAELQRHGHQSVLALSPAFEAQVKRLGLSFAPVGPDIQDALQNIVSARLEMTEFFTSVKAIRDFFSPIASALPQMFQDLRAVCQGADVLIAGPTQPAAQMIHELTGLPFAVVAVNPPGAGTEPTLQQARLAMVNPLRQQHGLSPLHDLTTAFASPQLNLHAMSRHTIPRPATWPAHYHLTGYFYLDDPSWQPDPQLVEFLAAGEPPVVISFGSMMHGDPAALSDLLLAAIQRVGCRAIIQQGWSGLAQSALPANVYPLGFTPHSWLFPRAACVVHHGGAGTTGAVLRAAVPQVFVPHTADQPIWADSVRSLGCAGPTVPYAQLTSERLAEAIAATLAEPRYRQAAVALGEKIRAEGGVSKARRLIEDLVEHSGLKETEPVSILASDRVEEARSSMMRRKRYQQCQRAKRDDYQ
jgi:sterol 3beta-glucosyltransferase